MRESAQAALSWVRAHADRLGAPDPEWFGKHDLHIHVPAGAVPKDGPSAGITMATAIVSLLTGKPVSEDVAMTGEITLTGQVLAIGGVKEKTLAAQRAGITTVVLPRENEADLDEIPKDVRRALRFVLVDSADEVIAEAIGGAHARPPEASVPSARPRAPATAEGRPRPGGRPLGRGYNRVGVAEERTDNA